MSRADNQLRRRNLLRLILHYIKFNTRAGMEYRTSFYVQVVGMALNNSAFIVFWLILFDRIGGSIQGYQFADVMFLWALAAAGFGLAGVTMANASQISRIIFQGDLDVYLLQPKPIIPNLVASRSSITAWGDLSYGILLFFLTQPIRFESVVLFLIFTLLAALLMTALRVGYHSITFFAGNAEEFASTASEAVVSFILYPGSIFEGPALWVLHSLIPAALIAYLPVRLIRNFSLRDFAILAAADLAIVIIAIVVFRVGLKRYESGNRMGTRV